MATTNGTQEFTAVEKEINQVLLDYGNTLLVTKVDVSDETDIDGEFTITKQDPVEFSGVTYDTKSLQRDFGESVILSSNESALLVSKDITFDQNDIISFKEYELVTNYIKSNLTNLKPIDSEVNYKKTLIQEVQLNPSDKLSFEYKIETKDIYYDSVQVYVNDVLVTNHSGDLKEYTYTYTAEKSETVKISTSLNIYQNIDGLLNGVIVDDFIVQSKKRTEYRLQELKPLRTSDVLIAQALFIKTI